MTRNDRARGTTAINIRKDLRAELARLATQAGIPIGRMAEMLIIEGIESVKAKQTS